MASAIYFIQGKVDLNCPINPRMCPKVFDASFGRWGSWGILKITKIKFSIDPFLKKVTVRSENDKRQRWS